MYEQFYNLSSRPFETTPDEKFIWLGDKHKEALAALRYGIIENKGFLLLTGEEGTGKTTVVNALVRNLGDDVEWAIISDPALDRIDFYNAIAAGYSLEKDFSSKVQFLIQFSHFLHQAHDEGKKVVLLIDNCQRLTQEMLEELRLLSNIEKTETKLINIFFIGRTEFNDMLVLPKNRAVRQRLMLKVELPSLSLGETEEYIKHRIAVGGVSEKIFAAKAVNAIHRISRGVPRNINILCAHAMVAGAVRGKKTIDHRLVEESLAKLGLPAHPSKDDIASLSAEHRSLENFREKFIANGGVMTNGVIGYNFEEENRYGWLKYGLAGAALIAFGAYLWWPQPQTVQVVDITTPPEKSREEINIPAKVGTSPAVTMLEQNNSAINEQKAAALKNAILEKAYSDDEGDQDPTEKDAAPVVAGDTESQAAPVVGAREAGVAEKTVAQQPEELTAGDSAVQTAAEQEAADMPEVVVVNEEPVEQAAVSPADAEVAAANKTEPEAEQAAAAQEEVQLPSINGEKFVLQLQANSVKLTRQGRRNLKALMEVVAPYPDAKILVKGYVSSDNNSPENIKLSEERAASVSKLLVQEGLSEDRLEIKGMGALEPIASNSTREGRAKNRRVEVVIVDDGL